MSTQAEKDAAMQKFVVDTKAFTDVLNPPVVVQPPAPPPAPAPQPPVAGTVLADENGTFTVAAATAVKFGADTRWVTKTVAAGVPTVCSPTFFGDPAPGIRKSCVSAGAPVILPPAPPAPPPTPPPVGQDAITTNGVIDPVKYVQVANLMSRAEGIAYRFGNPSTIPDAGLPTWYEPPSTHWPSALNQEGYYQLGSYVSDPTDYASNVGHVAFVADNPTQHIGVADIQCTNVSHMVFAARPELSWTRYGAGMNGDEAVWWKTHGHPNLKNPCCMARAIGRPTWSVQSIACFQDGFICTVGANTMTNKCSTQLAPGKVPTSISITSSNEFALITVWDTINLRGELCVMALCSLGGGCTIANPYSGDPEGSWGEWNFPRPGLAALGNFAFFKVLGYIPIPGMMAPTGCSCTTGRDPNLYARGVGSGDLTTGMADFIGNEALRLKWGNPSDWYYRHYAKEGFGMVISKTEKKLVFVDLNPLFDYFNSMYFGPSRADFVKTNNVGPNAGQWPFTFAEVPQQTPTFVKTFNMTSAPTSCLMYPFKYNNDPLRQSWVGTEDGKLHIYNLGGYPQAGNPANIVETGTVEVGPNPTSISNIKQKAFHNQTQIVGDETMTVMVCSRGDRAIRQVDMNGTGGGVVKRTFQDKRMKDPIWADDTENHGTEHFIVEVADYSGKQVLNFRYGPIIQHTNGGVRFDMGGPGKSDPFEFCGAMAFPGYPFYVDNANIS